MTDLTDLVAPDRVRTGTIAGNKKALIQQLAQFAADTLGLPARAVADGLAERERLGSTGFGLGTAIPHTKVDGLDQVRGAVIRLTTPIDFEAIDGLPVDIVFLLLSPRDGGAQHLKALARVSRRLRDPGFVAKLRGAGSPDAIYALLSAQESRDAA